MPRDAARQRMLRQQQTMISLGLVKPDRLVEIIRKLPREALLALPHCPEAVAELARRGQERRGWKLK